MYRKITKWVKFCTEVWFLPKNGVNATNNLVYELSKGYRTWIGGTDEVTEGEWIDDNGNPMSYFNWWTDGTNSEPDNFYQIQHCAFMNFLSPRAWGDIQCDSQLPCFACQYDIDECDNGSHNCTSTDTCVNHPGGFSCQTAHYEGCADS